MNNFKYHSSIKSELIYGAMIDEKFDLSIVIPTYKRTSYLKETINSIANQKPTNNISFEIIIVSNDPEFNIKEISDVLNPKLFKVYKNKRNIGMAGNMNRCALLARGKYIAYIQDDDYLLEDYLVTIENLLKNGKLEGVDCLIPNRYFLYDSKNTKSIFGAKAYKNEKKKDILREIISLVSATKDFQQIKPIDCANTWFNCYGGGPTCGILFRRDSLMNTNGFSFEYPYAFDFVFFLNFSEKYNVFLYNKYLSVYRMIESCSNRPDVQYDFFRSDMFLLDKMANNQFVKKYRNEIIRFSIKNKSKEAQKLIGKVDCSSKITSYITFRVVRFVNLMRSGIYRKTLLTQKKQ